jgi:hypothetical protein
LKGFKSICHPSSSALALQKLRTLAANTTQNSLEIWSVPGAT